MAGNQRETVDFEHDLAQFLGMDDAMIFSSAFLANVGAVRMLVDPLPYFVPGVNHRLRSRDGMVVADELVHASVVDGVRLTRADTVFFRHNDMGHLETVLRQNRSKRKLVVVDGVFSMDGDMADLPTIAKLCSEHDCLLYVDDSHGLGVLGPNGEGTAHHLGVASSIDVLVASFTKAFGGIGAGLAADHGVADYLRVTARSYIFSDCLPPVLVAGLSRVLALVRAGPQLRERLRANSSLVRTTLRELGFTVPDGVTPIVPVILGSESSAVEFSRSLRTAGIFAPAIRRPAVRPGSERIRLSVTAAHTEDHLARLFDAFRAARDRLPQVRHSALV